MNMITAHPRPPATSRLTGLGLAVGVHVAVALGFAGAFAIQQHDKPKTPPEVQLLKDPPPRKLEPLPPLRPSTVRIDTPEDVKVPVPVISIDSPAPGPVHAAADDGKPRDPGPVAPPGTTPVLRSGGLQSPGAVCSKMSTPVMPNVNGSGEALFRVVASTRAGRVTSIEIQNLRSTLDGRSLRAFRSSIETALRDGYECPGDVSFVQEFQFRLD